MTDPLIKKSFVYNFKMTAHGALEAQILIYRLSLKTPPENFTGKNGNVFDNLQLEMSFNTFLKTNGNFLNWNRSYLLNFSRNYSRGESPYKYVKRLRSKIDLNGKQKFVQIKF